MNVCDYALWDAVNARMRETEKKWKTKVETRDQFLDRLRRTALSLPEAVVKKMVMSMKGRCERLYQAKGGNIEEGVKKKSLVKKEISVKRDMAKKSKKKSRR